MDKYHSFLYVMLLIFYWVTDFLWKIYWFYFAPFTINILVIYS